MTRESRDEKTVRAPSRQHRRLIGFGYFVGTPFAPAGSLNHIGNPFGRAVVVVLFVTLFTFLTLPLFLEVEYYRLGPRTRFPQISRKRSKCLAYRPSCLGYWRILTNKTFWLPRERLSFKNEAPFTGYVLKVSEDRLMILNDEPRVVIQKPKAALQDRDFCYPEDHKARSSRVAADSPICP